MSATSSFRTFYDGVGGFFPLADTFQQLSSEQLHVDRGSFWFNATLAKPNRPVFTLSFHDDTRTGQKDSTEWGADHQPERGDRERGAGRHGRCPPTRRTSRRTC